MIRNDTLKRALACIALGSAIAVPAHAQILGGGGGGAPGNENPPSETYVLETPGESTGSFTRLCAGDFTGDTAADFALVQGGKVLLSGSPGNLPWWIATGISANDVATRSNETQTKDRFVTVHDDGVTEHRVLSTGVISSTVLEGSAWDGALFVETGQTLVGASLEDRIVGIKAGGETVEVLSWSGGSWNTAELVLGQPLGAPAVDMLLTDLDGNEELEVVIATAGALKCYELSSGNLIDDYAFSGYVTTGLCKGFMSTGTEFVVWTARKGGTDHMLAIDDQGLATYSNLGNINIVGSTTAEWRYEGESDLVLSLKNIDEMYVVSNTGANRPVFSLNSYTAIPLGETSITNSCAPASADVDFDGDVDLFLPMQTSEHVVVCRNANEEQQDALADILDFEDFGDFKATPHEQCATGNNDYYTLILKLGRPAGPGATATHVSYAVWKQGENPQYPGQPANWETQPAAVVLETHEDFEGPEVDLEIDIPAPDAVGCEASGTLSPHIYYLELQLLEKDAGGNVISRFPSKLIGVETEGFFVNNNGAYLNSIGMEQYWSIVYDPNTDPSNVGSADEVTALPNLTPGIAVVK